MGKELVIYHCHDTLSNLSTGIDSVTKATDYVKQAEKDGVKALGISNHGNVFKWHTRKNLIEGAGIKYLHAQEFYLTSDTNMENRKMDNYHTVLIAKNYEGFKELNRLSYLAYTRDHHFYGKPRLTFDELFATSDNIITTTACLANLLACEFNIYNVIDKETGEIIRTETKRDRIFGDNTAGYERVVNDYIEFLAANRHRCFLEVQHHNQNEQKQYNAYLMELSKRIDVPLIAGTDTHCLDNKHVRGRKVLQYRKGIKFPEEEGWDLTWKNYDSLMAAYQKQNALPLDVYSEAIDNTVAMAEMVEPFSLNMDFKYPKISDNPDEVLREHLFKKAKEHPHLIKRYGWDKVEERLNVELDTFKVCKSSNYILLQEYFIDWCKENGFHTGLGRGSAVGSLACYTLGVTEVDPIKHNLIFSRFMSPARVTLADIDIDIGSSDRPAIEKFVVGDHLNIDGIQSAVIMTEGTIDLKGSIKDVCGGFLEMYREERAKGLSDAENPYAAYSRFTVEYGQELSNMVEHDENNKPYIPDSMKELEPEVCEYVDIVRGTAVSLGVHASGKIIADRNIAEEIGLCTSKDTPYPVTILDMVELEELYWVKEDLLGLKNLAIVNKTCELAGINVVTPDTLDTDDMKVWEKIRWDTTGIFQFESNSAAAILREFLSPETIEIAKAHNPNFNMIDWVAIANAALRPAAASYRYKLARGEMADNGWDEINKLLAETNGYLVYQEQIMQFLVKFCGYSDAESDVVRRKIAHKGGTESIIPEIKERFINTSVDVYGLDRGRAENIIEPFLQIILDASRYAFNKSHAVGYTYLSYECGYLRTYYPLEFISSALNVFAGNEDKTAAVLQFAEKSKIKINNIKYGYSRANYFYDKETNAIYKGLASVKYMSEEIANKLYALSRSHYDTFMELILELRKERVVDTRQLDILIKLDFFSDFGNSKELTRIKVMAESFKYGEYATWKKENAPEDSYLFPLFEEHADGLTKAGKPAKSYKNIDWKAVMIGTEKAIKAQNTEDFKLSEKIAFQIEFLGYVSLMTGIEEDRPKLYIKDTYTLKNRATGEAFGTKIMCRSIGSGKDSEFTIFHKGRFNYKTKRRDESAWERCGMVKKGDVIYCKKYSKTTKGDTIYYNLDDYAVLFNH